MVQINGGKLFEEKMSQYAENASSLAVEIGFMQDKVYPDGTSVPLIAAVNEYGRPPVQPPRPFFRNMIAENSPTWPKAIADLLQGNDYDVETTLKQIGEGIAGQLEKSITELTDPPLAPSTIAAKGFDKPLIDTNLMRSSISYRIVHEGNE